MVDDVMVDIMVDDVMVVVTDIVLVLIVIT